VILPAFQKPIWRWGCHLKAFRPTRNTLHVSPSSSTWLAREVLWTATLLSS